QPRPKPSPFDPDNGERNMTEFARWSNFPPGLRHLPGTHAEAWVREPFWPEVGVMALAGSVMGLIAGLSLAMMADSFSGMGGGGFAGWHRLPLYATFVVCGASLGATGMALLGALLIGAVEGIAWLCRGLGRRARPFPASRAHPPPA